jgi:hypothetical protein
MSTSSIQQKLLQQAKFPPLPVIILSSMLVTLEMVLSVSYYYLITHK